MKLRCGYTTGTCATAAAKAAAQHLCEGIAPESVEVPLPDGSRAVFAVIASELTTFGAARAEVRKDAGDDPDVTHEARIVAEVEFIDGDGVEFVAGDGVGTVTKPGLSLPPGEPAINPAPRRMIREALREVTPRGVRVTISIPGGRELAEKTFNPRLGIVGGISIIGTTGIVKPFSAPALKASLKCALDVAAASGVTAPVLVPGNIGERAALRNFPLADGRIIQVSNHWGFMLDEAAAEPRFERFLMLGHPGKLAKLVDGEWDTHSSSSASATEAVARIGRGLPGAPILEGMTVEGIFASCPQEQVGLLGDALAVAVHQAIRERIGGRDFAVVLVNLAGDILGTFGNLQSWT
jgi:cobalt-precorrin-5B (C1)-methyltransferase